MSSDLTRRIQTKLDAATARYVARNPRSKTLHEEAVKAMPGGNTRNVLHASPFPVVMKSGKGYQVTSEDGHAYTDLTAEFTAALYGHSNPVILSAIRDVLNNTGLNVGATTAQEQVFAHELCKRFDLEHVRFANSGTEANIHALAAARAFTKKRKIVTFSGGYHGAVIGFKGGKPEANNVDPDDWVVARYNDLESARRAIAREGVAAVLIEGMQGSGGGLTAKPEFLQGAGVLFIIDEVMTSRMSGGGISELRGLKPDLKTFGKWLGGGLAFGAFGGRADIMAAFDPRLPGALSHSGTFNNNTLVTHAGYAGLSKIYTPEVASQFTKLGDELRERLNEVTKGTRVVFTGLGSIMGVHFPKDGTRVIERGGEVEEIDALRDLFWLEMLEEGFWVVRRGFIALVLETPTAEFDRFVRCVEAWVAKHTDIVTVTSKDWVSKL
ncbi:glutamate-1-semialdehyde 21-aminomutase [Fusarium albosuccineum]|uniref:Glutamate-1-semialdehyde 21-aminomutase n=1 Tax=Fusarium albosuccineum TaxID=1237068 RepID=A0A8H4LME7_9HYPO|nr:glutamate-1-semialdehyde 21-aminomutase [Fusarium albosuccineum]